VRVRSGREREREETVRKGEGFDSRHCARSSLFSSFSLSLPLPIGFSCTRPASPSPPPLASLFLSSQTAKRVPTERGRGCMPDLPD
jgi:hypothetical protein